MSAGEHPRLIVLYGSQTGTARDVALRVARAAARLPGLKSRVRALDRYQPADLPEETLAVFVVSTTGQGEEPDNMRLFWRRLMHRDLPAVALAGLHFAVIGLGDSSYLRYNVVAKKVFRRLLNLSARPLIPLVLADDQHPHGPEGAIEPGLRVFWEAAAKLMKRPPFDFDTSSPPLPFCQATLGTPTSEPFTRKLPKVWGRVTEFPDSELVSNQKLTGDDHFQDVRLLEFNLNEDADFLPGAVAVIQPSNQEDAVEEFLNLLSEAGAVSDFDTTIQVSPRETDFLDETPPDSWTLRHLATHYWDLNQVPKKSFFEIFQHFSQLDIEREKLKEFCSPEGQDDLWEYTERPRRTVLEVLKDFPHTTPHVPLEYWFDLLSPIQPRFFSIASSPTAHRRHLQLLVAVVKYKTRMKTPRLGLCSNWLAGLIPGTPVPLSVKPTEFFVPQKDVPVIMVGPGTGVAPFRALIEARTSQGESGENLLFFGCRNESQDFFFSGEWQELEAENRLTLYTAFSRDQPSKVYVQHRIRQKGALVWSLIQRGAIIYIAGSSRQMPQQVIEALTDAVSEHGSMKEQDALQFVDKLIGARRLQLEVW